MDRNNLEEYFAKISHDDLELVMLAYRVLSTYSRVEDIAKMLGLPHQPLPFFGWPSSVVLALNYELLTVVDDRRMLKILNSYQTITPSNNWVTRASIFVQHYTNWCVESRHLTDPIRRLTNSIGLLEDLLEIIRADDESLIVLALKYSK